MALFFRYILYNLNCKFKCNFTFLFLFFFCSRTSYELRWLCTILGTNIGVQELKEIKPDRRRICLTPKGGHICECNQNYEFDFINTLASLCSLFFSSCSRTPCDGSAQARQQVGRPTYHFLVFHWFFDFCISHVPVQTCLARILRKQ